MDYTQNLHLPQWEADDRIQMDDFNDAFAAIDTAVKANADAAAAAPHIIVGSYTGDDVNGRTIELGVTPQAVLVVRQGYQIGTDSYIYGGLAVANVNTEGIRITTGGFTVSQSGNCICNSRGKKYNYISIC